MQNRAISYTMRIVSIIVVMILTIVIYRSIDNSRTVPPIQQTIREQYDLQIGDNITLNGLIVPDGDMGSYTHTIVDEFYGVVGLKSRTNLNIYKGPVMLEATIDSFLQEKDMFVVWVDNVVLLPEDQEQEVVEETVARYIRSAGIYFPVSFFDIYDDLDTRRAGTIIVTDDEESYSINYFLCTSDKADTDCLYLEDSFSATATKVFTTNDGMTFYKMSEADSWFAHNE